MDQQPSYSRQSEQHPFGEEDYSPQPPPAHDVVDWNQAEQYLKFLFQTYQRQIASSMDRVNEKILPLMKKLHDGERSQQLYKEILDLSSPLPDHNGLHGNGHNGNGKLH